MKNVNVILLYFKLMKELCDIIMALIEYIPWLVVAYSVHVVCKNKPSKMFISFMDKLKIETTK